MLGQLYAKMANAPVKVDLPDLFRRLGVSGGKDRVTYDDAAPLVAIRTGITMGGSGPAR